MIKFRKSPTARYYEPHESLAFTPRASRDLDAAHDDFQWVDFPPSPFRKSTDGVGSEVGYQEDRATDRDCYGGR